MSSIERLATSGASGAARGQLTCRGRTPRPRGDDEHLASARTQPSKTSTAAGGGPQCPTRTRSVRVVAALAVLAPGGGQRVTPTRSPSQAVRTVASSSSRERPRTPSRSPTSRPRASGSARPTRCSARVDRAHTRPLRSATRKASRSRGRAGASASSIRPSPQRAQTRVGTAELRGVDEGPLPQRAQKLTTAWGGRSAGRALRWGGDRRWAERAVMWPESAQGSRPTRLAAALQRFTASFQRGL